MICIDYNCMHCAQYGNDDLFCTEECPKGRELVDRMFDSFKKRDDFGGMVWWWNYPPVIMSDGERCLVQLKDGTVTVSTFHIGPERYGHFDVDDVVYISHLPRPYKKREKRRFPNDDPVK